MENFNKRFKESHEIYITYELEKIEEKVNKLDPQKNLNLLIGSQSFYYMVLMIM